MNLCPFGGGVAEKMGLMEVEEAVMSAFKKILRGDRGIQGRVVAWGVLGWLCLLNVTAWGQIGWQLDVDLVETGEAGRESAEEDVYRLPVDLGLYREDGFGERNEGGGETRSDRRRNASQAGAKDRRRSANGKRFLPDRYSISGIS